MIDVNGVDTRDHYEMEVAINNIFKQYASWFLGQLNLEELLGVWCVGNSNNLVTSLPLELQSTPPRRCWPELKRIRLECIECDDFSVEKNSRMAEYCCATNRGVQQPDHHQFTWTFVSAIWN